MGWHKMRWHHYAPEAYAPTPEEELEYLKYVKAELELKLKYVSDRIAELEKNTGRKE